MMSDEILFQDGNNFIGTCYQGFMDGSEFCASMIEVTTMFAPCSLGRDTGRNRKQEGLLTGNNRQRA
jgi:hypothetical protein